MALKDNEKNLLHVSATPHVRYAETTQSLMLDVVIAMLPAAAFSVYRFGIRALLIMAVTVVSAVLAEYFFEYFMKKPITVGDFSAVVTGLILALNMPPTIPLFIPVIGAIFAIIVVKQLYGGLGQNFMNPALAARCFLLISFSKAMTDFGSFEVSTTSLGAVSGAAQAVSGATPLAVLKAGQGVELSSLFFGNIPGTLGEVSVVCLLLGAAYLIVKEVISIRIPLTYIATTVILMGFFGGRGFDPYYLACEACAGGLIFGAFFMATDYVTGPLTPMGQIVYGVVLGVLTALFRAYGASAEGVSYAIILGNILVPLIEKLTVPTPFGMGRYRKATDKSLGIVREEGKA